MIRSILSLGALLAFLAPSALAQATPAEGSSRSPAIAYAMALLATIIIMVIVCTPSRKR
jgi:hypothetical protein